MLRIKSWLPLVGWSVLGLAACGEAPVRDGAGEAHDDDVAEVVAALRNVPSIVRCVRVVVTQGSTTTSAQTAVPQGDAEIAIGALALGPATLQAFAYEAACNTSTVSIPPSWRSDAITVALTAASASRIELSLYPASPTEVDARFEVDVADMALGASGCAIGQDDRAYCTDGDTESKTHLAVRGQALETLSLGGAGTANCTILESGQIRCCGDNGWGQLGDGTLTHRKDGSSVAVLGLTNATDLDVGFQTVCAIADKAPLAQRVFCWGRAHALIPGVSSYTATPVELPLPVDAYKLALGAMHACALTVHGSVLCWGNSDALGGSVGADGFSRPVTGAVVDVQAASEATFALMADGTVRAWGRGTSLGTGDSSASVLVPKTIPGITSAVELSASAYGGCVRHKNGSVSCWGANANGEVGDGTSEARAMPVLVASLGYDVTRLFGGYHTITTGTSATFSTSHCTLHRSGKVSCWGENGMGQLGDGTRLKRFAPVEAVWW